METAFNWCLATCRCPWAFGSDYYTNLDSEEGSGRLDRRALLEGDAAAAQQPSTSSEPRYRVRTVPKPVSPRKAKVEACPTEVVAHSNDQVEVFMPANEVLSSTVMDVMEGSELVKDDLKPSETIQTSEPKTDAGGDDEPPPGDPPPPPPVAAAAHAGNGKRRRRRKKRPQKET